LTVGRARASSAATIRPRRFARRISLPRAFSILRLSGALDSVKESLEIARIFEPGVGDGFGFGAAGVSGAVRICRIFTLCSLRIAFSRHASDLP